MNDLKNTKPTTMKFPVLIGTIALTLLLTSSIFAQTQKEALKFNDVRLWRTHSNTLSDNGEWYTTKYRLIDKPESKKDSIFKKLSDSTSQQFYNNDNKTDILYVNHTKSDLKYQIIDGRKPIFSSNSEWISYKIRSESNKSEKDAKIKDTTFIELKHLKSAFTVRYESDAKYSFLEGKNYFITEEKNNILIYDLENRKEHFIGNIGEYLVDEKSPYITYTINSKDRRGNGIYLYNPVDKTTRAIATGNFIYSNVSWNKNKDAIAAYIYNKKEKKIDDSSISIIVIDKVESKNPEISKYSQGMPESMALAVSIGKTKNNITWSNDDKRLFVKLKHIEKDIDKDYKETQKDDNAEKSNVQIWHWKDKKLLSERIMKYDDKKSKTYDAIFFRNSNKIVQLTSTEIQNLVYSKGTDNWAIGTDDREYISDWDVNTYDLYRINLETGEKMLIEKKYRSRFGNQIEISPDGTKAILWDEAHYWCYDIEKNTKRNITKDLSVSFVDKDYDKYGYIPNYGFVGWLKDQNAIIINHKLDLWSIPVDGKAKPKNLTKSITSKDSIRFRFEDYGFLNQTEIEDRYIDLSKPTMLHAFNIQTKYAGYYNFQRSKLEKLIYKPVSFSSPYRRYSIIKSKNSDVIIYKMGDYNNYPDSYLSTLSFANPKKISNTNPQQKQFKWGKRILIDYTNDDGVPLQGILSIPENYKLGKKLPMIVYSYEKHSRAFYTYPSNYLSGTSIPEMLYVSNGYLFLQPDIHFNVGTPHSDMHECIDAAIEKVIKMGYVDTERIGYQGYSFGGHTGMYVSTQDNKFAAIAAGGGVSNLVQGFNLDIVWDGSNEQDYYMTGQGRLGADPTSKTEMYISESPVFNAKNMNTPLLLFAGTNDKVVQWEHSFGFYSILRYLKKPVVFLSYRGEGHGLRGNENTRLDVQRRLKEFFDYYLKGVEAKKWMLEESAYQPEQESKKKDKDKRTLPKWK